MHAYLSRLPVVYLLAARPVSYLSPFPSRANGSLQRSRVARMSDEESLEDTSAWPSEEGNGYPALADFKAQDADHETYVFRKFKRLAVRNILHLQGELLHLEAETEALEREAAASTDIEVLLSMRCWAIRDENARAPDRDLERKLKESAEAVDVKLKKYCQYLPSTFEESNDTND